MFKWIKDIWSLRSFNAFTKRMYTKMDEKRKKNNEVWHYTCENGHKWESYSSPGGTFCEETYGMLRTRCPTCNSDICMGSVYINGEKTAMGAVHIDMIGKQGVTRKK